MPGFPEYSHKCRSRHMLQTKHANIAKVLGSSEELKFNTVRDRLKSKPTPSKDDKLKHKRLLYKLQLLVQRKCSILITQLSSLEKEYFLQHCQLPKPNDSPEYDGITTQVKHINKINCYESGTYM